MRVFSNQLFKYFSWRLSIINDIESEIGLIGLCFFLYDLFHTQHKTYHTRSSL